MPVNSVAGGSKLTVVFFGLLLGIGDALAYSSFRPRELWLGTDCSSIRDHSGGIFSYVDKFYWYGSDAYANCAATLNRNNTKIDWRGQCQRLRRRKAPLS